MRDRRANTLRGGLAKSLRALLMACLIVAGFCSLAVSGYGQENPLNNVETPTAPPKPKTPEEKKPVIEGGDVATQGTAHRDARLRVNVNLVQVPLTVTDPMNRLVTGLEKENFFLYDNNIGQSIKYFSSQDAPLTIGVIFDLSGSMSSKFVRARKALTEFLRTSNPQDEFIVVGFQRPAVGDCGLHVGPGRC